MLIVLRYGSPVGYAAEDDKRWWRDREIMRLAHNGMTNREIGAHMGLSKDWISRRIQHRLREGWAISKTLGDYPMYHRK